MIEAYPLCWPNDYPRSKSQKDSRFTTTLGRARDYVKEEIRRIGGKNPVISTDVPLKNDGDLRADWQKYKLDDTGVAVYFEYYGSPVCLCCDTYKKVYDNLHAVGRTIEALRQIDRDGVSDFLKRAFTGFTALPEPGTAMKRNCWDVLNLSATRDKEAIHNKYRELAKEMHPDKGGSTEAFCELQEARDEAINFYN